MQWTRFGTVTASVYLAAGRLDVARQEIARGLTAAADRDARGYRAPLLRLEAEVLAVEGDAAIARQRSEEALAVALELGTRPEIGHCHTAIGRVVARAGDSTRAAEHRAAARQIFDELGMTFWGSRATDGPPCD